MEHDGEHEEHVDTTSERVTRSKGAGNLRPALCEESLIDVETTWDSLALDNRLLKAVARAKFAHPTLIQACSIPLALQGKDILAKARTGSGKTAAYVLPILQKLLLAKEGKNAKKGVKALILVPTRELCDQAKQHLDVFAYYCAQLVSSVAIAGTGALTSQKTRLAELPDIVIATPARLVAHLNAKNLVLKDSLEMLVIDEADLILSYGYEDDVRTIVGYLPKICQGFLMSATLSTEVEALRQLVLHTPAVLKLEEPEKSQEELLTQYSVKCKEQDKYLITYATLRLKLLQGKVLFFVNAIDRGYKLKLFLERFAIKAAVLNSELPHNSRQHIIEDFNRGVFEYLIATDEGTVETNQKNKSKSNGEEEDGDDIDMEEAEEESSKKKSKKSAKGKAKANKDAEFGVARGVDFKEVQAVVNFDFPTSVKNYMHRVGRTARGGQSGTALSFVSEDDEKKLARVAEYLESEGKAIRPYEFKLEVINGLRYRVEDVLRGVTKIAIRDARLAEIKTEILNSQKLKAHFEDNPKDRQLLQHDRPLQEASMQRHLRHLPEYLMPSLKGPTAQPKRKATNRRKKEDPKRKKKKEDPLRSFNYDGAENAENAEEIPLEDGNEDGAEEEEPKQTGKKHKKNPFLEEPGDEEKELDRGYQLAFGKKRVNERKLKYLQGKNRKHTVATLKKKAQEERQLDDSD